MGLHRMNSYINTTTLVTNINTKFSDHHKIHKSRNTQNNTQIFIKHLINIALVLIKGKFHRILFLCTEQKAYNL